MMTITVKRTLVAGTLLVFCLGLGRAAMSRFHEKEQAIRQGCTADLAKSGMTRNASKAKYPTPEIHMVSSGCVAPGAVSDVVVKGKFAPGTRFVFENDNVEVVKESVTPTEYRASVKVPAGSGPQTAAVAAFSPANCLMARHDRAIVVGGKYEWTMDAANGWRIVARARGAKNCGAEGSHADAYDLKFFRKGETTPFEKREAELYFSVYEKANYSFSISTQDPQTQAGIQDMQTLAQKLSDPKLTNAQRDQVMKQIERAQTQMQAQIQQMTNPAWAKEQEAKKLEFGCERIELESTGGNLTGTMRCSQKVGTRLALTGTMKAIQ